MFDPTVKLTDILTSVSVCVASAALVYAWLKDRRLRRKEYADRVRKAAADTTVALERWRKLARHLFDDVQPYVVDADSQFVKDGDVIKVRDDFWRNLHAV